MDGREKREELAARIKAGEKSLLPMLWGECRGTVIIMAAKYRSIIEQNAFVDMEDFIQCGYFAMLEAVEAYNPEKGYVCFISFVVVYTCNLVIFPGILYNHICFYICPVIYGK